MFLLYFIILCLINIATLLLCWIALTFFIEDVVRMIKFIKRYVKRGWLLMGNGAWKKFRKTKIKGELKKQATTKVLSDALLHMKDMTDEEWEAFAVDLANELGVEDVDREEIQKALEEKVENNG